MPASDLLEILDERGITLSEFSRRTRVARSTLRSWIAGTRQPTRRDRIASVARELGITVAKLRECLGVAEPEAQAKPKRRRR